MLVETRDALAPDARIMVQADALVWRGLRHVTQVEHRDLLVVGSASECEEGRIRVGTNVDELLEHLECPLAIAPAGLHQQRSPALRGVGVGFDGGPESQAALDLGRSVASAAGVTLSVPTQRELAAAGPAWALGELSHQVDLLVIGSSRQGRPGRVGLAATERAVLLQAACPVVVVPRP